MGEAFLVQKNAAIKTPDPTVNLTSINFTSINVRLTNNHDKPVTMYYELDNALPNANTITVGANSFEDITLSSLSSNTAFTLYVYAKEDGQVPSDTLDAQFTTLTYTTQAPTINVTNTETDEVTFTLKNNDTSTVTMYYEVNDSTPDITATVSGGATITRTIGSLSDDTNYTLFARARASNENMSSTVSKGFQTDTDLIPPNALFYFDPNNSNSYSGSGSTVTDLSPNGNNFTLNGPSFINDGGINVFDFNSSGDSINGSLDLRRDWSFEIWVKQLQTHPITFLGQGPTSTNQGLHIWQYSNDDIRFGMYSNDRDARGISTSTNVWYQYVFTYNHSTREKKIYRNNARIDNTTVKGPNQYSGTGTLRIGQIYSTTSQNRDSRKRVGEIIMYNYPLSDADVSNSFNLRRGRYGI